MEDWGGAWWLRDRVVFENYKPIWDMEIQRTRLRLDIGSKIGVKSALYLLADFVYQNLWEARKWRLSRRRS